MGHGSHTHFLCLAAHSRHYFFIAVWCQFHQHFYLQIFRTDVISAAFTTYMQLEKAAKTTFVRNFFT